MKHLVIIVFCFNFLKANSQAPNLLFARGFGGINSESGNTIAVDLNNNIYVGGAFDGTADFDPGPAVVTKTCAGINDLFFAKFDGLGNYVWVKTIGSPGRETVNSIAVDKLGNSYITGYFEGTADFDPGPGIVSLMAVGSGRDFFFAKYDANGNYVWAKNLKNGLSDDGNSLTLDTLGNVYLTGVCKGSPDFDPGPGTATISTGVFFAKYDLNGNYLWAHSLPSNGFHTGKNIKLDAAGNVYITGYYQGTMDFDPSVATATINGGNQSAFFAKYDNGGNYVWAKKIGTGGYNYGSEISLDQNNNVYITGVFSGTTDFDPGVGTATITTAGLGDIFFAKYNSAGDYVWAKTMGGNGWEEGYSITNDANNNIYLTGYFIGTIDIDPASTIHLLSAGSGAPEIFIAKYDTSGNYIWAMNFGASGNDQSNQIVLDKTGNVYITGFFQNTVDFDPGPGTTNLICPGNGDVFFAKYSSTVNGLQESKNNSISVILSPNPNNGIFNLTLEKEIEKGEIILTNAIGQGLYKQPLIKGENNIKVQNLTKGIYFYSIRQSNQQISSGKLIIE